MSDASPRAQPTSATSGTVRTGRRKRRPSRPWASVAHGDPVFAGLARVAAQALGAPIAMVTRMEEDRVRVEGAVGVPLREVARVESLCAHVVAAGRPLVVPDATLDPRFEGNRFVVGEPGIRFYAAAPIVAADGAVLGTVCVIDTSARPAPAEDGAGVLADLARAASAAFEGRRTSRDLESTEERYRQLVDLATDAILAIGEDGTVRYANPYAVESFGHAHDVLRTMHVSELVAPGELDTHLRTFRAIRQGAPVCSERTMIRADGSTFIAEIRTRRTPDGGYQAILRDVTEQRTTLERMRSYARFRQGLVRLAGDLMTSGDEGEIYRRVLALAVDTIPGAQAGSILERDDRVPERFGFVAAQGFDIGMLRRAALLERELQWDPGATGPTALHGFDPQKVADPARLEALWGCGPTADIRTTLVVPARHRDRTVAWLLVDSFEDDAFGEDAMEMAMLAAQQLAALLYRARLDRELQVAALTDPLTGLPNRESLTRTLEARTSRQDPATVLFLDLDDFKVVNDGFGHGAGDELLRRAAGRLAGCLRGEDVAARWAGDEFVILLGRSLGSTGTEDICARLFRALSRPFRIRDRDLFVRASIGVATASEGVDARELIEWADMALSHAKRRGKNCFAAFEPAMRESLVLRRDLEDDLRYALRHDEFTAHYQPRIDLRDGRIRSVEALARWPHPKRGPISPAVFIPLAEQTGMIHELGRQMLDVACRQAKLWSTTGTPVRVAVNISARQLVQPDFVAMILCALENHRLEPALLELEITESVAASEGTAVAGKLEALHALGIHISIDDFGTAYSSLSRLRKLPIQSLKIDQSFVRDLDGDEPEKAASVVRAIVTLARSLNLQIVAEGIETEAQRAVLHGLEVDEAQGYLFARPAPSADVSELLAVS